MARIEKTGLTFHEIRREHFSHPALDARSRRRAGADQDRAGPRDHARLSGRQIRCRADAGRLLGHRHAFRRRRFAERRRRLSRACHECREGLARLYDRPRIDLHTDSAEIVGLLCVRDAKEGGLSIYSSSLKVHEIIAREHPEYLAVLERGFRCDRRGEEAPEDDPVTPYRVPVFSTRDGVLSCRFVRGVIDKGAERLGETLSTLEQEALACFEEVAQRDDLRFEVMLRPGEASFINNYEILHARTGFVDRDDPAKKAAAVPALARRQAAASDGAGSAALPEPLRPYGRRSAARPRPALSRRPEPDRGLRHAAGRRAPEAAPKRRIPPARGDPARARAAARRRPRRLSDRDRVRARRRRDERPRRRRAFSPRKAGRASTR